MVAILQKCIILTQLLATQVVLDPFRRSTIEVI